MKKSDVVSLDTLDEYYTKTRKIKFNNDIQIESLDNIYDSLFYKKLYTNLPTYYSRGARHCKSGRARSIDDFFRISKFYFPNMNIKEIIIFLKLKNKEELKNREVMRLFFCNTIRKYNFHGIVSNTTYYKYLLDYNFLRDGFINFNKSIVDIV